MIISGIDHRKILREDTDFIKEFFDIVEVAYTLGFEPENNKIPCFYHNDSDPSMVLYSGTNTFHCFGCGKSGNIFNLVMDAKEIPFRDAILWIKRHRGRLERKGEIFPFTRDKKKQFYNLRELSPLLPSVFFKNLSKDDRLYLKNKKGLTSETITKFCIGKNNTKRFTIPIYYDNKLINFRLYNPDADAKMIPFRKGVGMHLFGRDELKDRKWAIFCEGEWDRIILEQNGIPSITATGGAGSFRSDWKSHFEGKSVYILFDLDEAGIRGAEKIKKALSSVTKFIKIIDIPSRFPRGTDVSDLFIKYHFTKLDFSRMLQGDL